MHEAERGSVAFKVTIHILLALAIGISVLAAKEFLFGDKAGGARAGDCVHGTSREITAGTAARAEVVPCDSAEADYEVAGRVNGTTDADGPACDTFFSEGEKFIVYSSTGNGGYLLCLRPRAS
ncbi:hypothetical protein [Actinoplanes sp. NPDC089786]|uniref:LppU/SCO3897 family protein n=1 Tax=Actinoplanes sp. NPDC089786 TaxID=3155185 RepID=UPI00342AD296